MRTAALNWMPFRGAATGASRRAVELHSRLTGSFRLVVCSTGELQSWVRSRMKEAELLELAPSRTLPVRLLEGSSIWWRRALRGMDADLWSTDTLPLVRMPGTRACITVHDLRFQHGIRYLGPWRYILLASKMRAALRRADAVVTVSRWTASMIGERYGVPGEKLHVVPNAVDPAMKRLAEETRHPYPRPYLLAVGHLERRKNLPALVRAFARVDEASGHLLVLAGGDGGEAAGLRRMAEELGVGGRVVIPGRVPEDRLAALYSGCSVLVCPSLYEGFGMTLLEGMSMGVPVVASSIPPHREVGGHAPLWVDPGPGMDERLAEAIRRVLDDEALARETGVRGRQRSEKFSWDESARLLGKVYAGLMD